MAELDMQRYPSTSSVGADDYYNDFSDDNHDDLSEPVQHERSSVQEEVVKGHSSLAHIHVPSFRSFASSIPVPSPTAIKRKPAPFGLARSPRAASFSLAETSSPRLAEPSARPFSLDSPLPKQPNGHLNELSPPLTAEFTAQHEDRASHSYSYPPPHPHARTHDRTQSIDARLATVDTAKSNRSSWRSSIPVHMRYAHEQEKHHAPRSSTSGSEYSVVEQQEKEQDPMHMPQAPSMTLQFDGVQRTLSDSSLLSEPTSLREQQRPKSPGRLGGLFNWKSASRQSGSESPTTTFSDRSISPLPSPGMFKGLLNMSMDSSTSTARAPPSGLDIQKANTQHASSQYFENPDAPLLLGSSETNAHVRELERELAEISTELAGSIRREMDLEDELYRVKMGLPTPTEEAGRRTSDYFSDSGASSVRYPVTDPDARLLEMEAKVRKAEQEKAQIKVDVAGTLQSELARRRDLEQIVHALEEQLHKRFDEDERVGELEKHLEEARRRHEQERQAKDSFGDLYTATKLELVQNQKERDNLRDEIVPQLHSRIEGLEAEAGDVQAIMYENTRLQQEVAALKEAQNSARFSSIAEEADPLSPITGRGAFSRSNSLSRTRSTRGGSIARSGSVKERSEGGRQRSGSVSAHTGPVSSEVVKEIEDQRDALHKALKLLISRHEKQQRDHQRAVRKLTRAKVQAETITPKRTAYHADVAFLKDEVTTLRKRTEDALEQKWQYEKGLSGVKMDLDRAEQETRGLRDLLLEHDTRPTHLSGHGSDDDESSGSLHVSLTLAESQRDQARSAAETYRQRAQDQDEDPQSAQDLNASAQRMEALADQLEEQVQANVLLRDRLAEAIAKGEKEQKVSTRQIEDMQKRLAGVEESVLTAQQHSENLLGEHEGEVRRIEEASSPSLQRLRISIPSPNKLSPAPSPALFGPRSPAGRSAPGRRRLDSATLSEASRTHALERKVKELEGLLREAEDDVQVVVQRVQRSQLEVAELQMERDAAMVQMRKLMERVGEERGRVEGV
ncbi:hypothetical protein LTR62_008357 [Meristemomyces frigidus]|uniref:DUF7603 domain-containing protein n=1 Tax=Meristemomyces frigidus TaxID=1508187 RepID=A0AAN7YH74_9PEZI|nr:hypothetical protein LTR62_008357 [Meristemomyces frigidus]